MNPAEVKNCLDSLFQWGSDAGWQSHDYYWKQNEIYPMSLGYFLRAAVQMARTFPREDLYRSTATELLRLALSRANLRDESRYPHWGLPFPWPKLSDQAREDGETTILAGDFFWDEKNPLFTGPLPAHHGYAVTTAIVGQGILDAREWLGEEGLEACMAGIGRWFLEDCGVRPLGDGLLFFNYSPHMRHLIYNGSALAAAFMARAGHKLGEPSWIEQARAAMRLLESVQDSNGAWVYARERQEIEYHFGYYLESLAIYQRATGDDFSMEILRKGADFYLENFFEADGKSYDNLERAFETRLWAYGWAVFAFMDCWEITGEKKYLDQAHLVTRYLMRHHWNEEAGAFCFRPGVPEFFMRDEAHVAYGLAKVLAAAKPEGTDL